MRTVSCGCCTEGCVCWNHQDVPAGRPVATCSYHQRHPHPHATSLTTKQAMLAAIRPGDRVTILVPSGFGRHGQEWSEKTGRAVMRNPHGWALNMGGPHGTPGVANEGNVVRVKKGRKP